MVEFQTAGYGPMDREYHESASEVPEPVKLEEPIFPINRLGETVPEQDPSGRFKNVIQSTQAAIRGGAGTVQLVMMTPHTSAIGGRPKAYGKEVREALREVALASNVNIAGVEMPTSSLTNMSGFDAQQLSFSDEKRVEGLNEVKDAMRFVADVGGGGGVDIVAFEYPRGVNEAPWQPKEEDKQVFHQAGEQPIGWMVDERTGRTIQFRKTEIQHLPYDKETFEYKAEPSEAVFKRAEELPLEEFEWKDFKKWAERNKEWNAQNALDPETGKPRNDRPTTPEGVYVEVQLKGQVRSLEGMRERYIQDAETVKRQLDEVNENMEYARTEQQRDKLAMDQRRLQRQYDDFIKSAYGNQQQAEELKERLRHIRPIQEYAVDRSARTYAEAGIEAWKVTEEGMAKGRVDPNKPVYVGPEIGWPGYFGSHPDEFIQIIKDARNQMVDLLTNPKPKDIHGKPMGENPYYDPSITADRAQELADKHVKGLFDTSHMGMWLQHFKAKPGETEEERVKRFNDEFYLPAVKKIADAGVIGGIQMVDAISGAHAHLPPGQGNLPLTEAAKIFQQHNYQGFIVSEGHEEEKFGEGRIRTKLWETAGATIGQGYFAGRPPLQWRDVRGSYFGRTYSPNFMFGGYSPSNEFKLWSEVPLE